MRTKENAGDKPMRDITAAFQGITIPLSELVDDLHRRGWTLQKLHIKDGNYVAIARNPHKETLEAAGRTEATAVGNVLVKVMRREHMRSSATKSKLGAWSVHPIEQQFSAIAMAYAQSPVYDPKAASAWMELGQDFTRRAQTIKAQVSIEFTNDPVPYQSADDLREDVTRKRHVLVTRAYAHHPVWSEAQMLDYRLVVDVLGHTLGGADWGWHGTCLAFAQLAPLLAEAPQKALFTELLGQAAFGQFYRQWGPQKITFLDKEIEKLQKQENKPGHYPVHPSQSIVPMAVPRFGGVWQDWRDQRGMRKMRNDWDNLVERSQQQWDTYRNQIGGKPCHWCWDGDFNNLSQAPATTTAVVDYYRGQQAQSGPIVVQSCPMCSQEVADNPNGNLAQRMMMTNPRGTGVLQHPHLTDEEVFNQPSAVVGQPKVAAMTAAQRHAFAQTIESYAGQDTSATVHEFPDGWSIRQPLRWGDMEREGQLMSNCLRLDDPNNEWLKSEDPEEGPGWFSSYDGELPDQILHSLRDPYNLPHISFYQDPTGFGEVLGQHNTLPKKQYLDYLHQYGEKAGIPHDQLERYWSEPSAWEQSHLDEEAPSQNPNQLRLGAIVGQPKDPNADWESGVTPLPDNAYLWQRQNGVDPLDIQNVQESLRPLEPGLTNMHPQLAKQSVVNAMRSTLLGARQTPRGHAIHYQTVMHIPADVDDPMAYHDALEQGRENWNTTQGYAPESHKQYWPQEQQFQQWVKSLNPELDDAEVRRTAKRELLHMLAEEEERVLAQDPSEELPAEMVEHQAFEGMKNRLKALTKGNVDQKVDFGDTHLWHEASEQAMYYHQLADPNCKWCYGQGSFMNDDGREIPCGKCLRGKVPSTRDLRDYSWSDDWGLKQRDLDAIPTQDLRTATYHADMYPPYLHSRMRPMAQISRSANTLSEAAREDLLEHKGHGHHFRSAVLSLGIPGVGPRQASLAWLHLAPQTSQLGIVNPEMTDLLGRQYDQMSNRDYFKHERELAAGRDAAGYGHTPLGAFTTGLWDQYAGGEGWHPDRSPFRAYAPTPHNQVDWNAQVPPMTGWTSPYWWESTQEARDGAAQDFDRSVGTQFSKDEIPFQKTATGFDPQMFEEPNPYGDYEARPLWTRTHSDIPCPNCGDHLIFSETDQGPRLYCHDCGNQVPVPQDMPLDQRLDVVDATQPGAYGEGTFLPGYTPKWGSTGAAPWVLHPSTGERLTGAPGTSLMQHLKGTFGHQTCTDVWGHPEYQVGKGSIGTVAKVAMGEWGPDGNLVGDHEEPLSLAYHTSPKKNRELIERDGLVAGGDPDVDPGPSVFMTRNRPEPESGSMAHFNPTIHDLYEVDVSGLPVRYDPWGEQNGADERLYGPHGGSLYHPGNIPPERIRRLTQ